MNKEFVKYEQALALKELGFDEPCLGFYYPLVDGVSQKFIRALLAIDETDISEHFQKHSTHTKAPLYQQAFRWFRDVYELEGVPQKADSFSWFKFCIWKYTSNGKHRVNDAFDFEHKTYEEAESACLDKLIEIIKNK